MSMAAEKLARTSLSGSRGAAVTGGRNFQSHRAPLAVTLLDAGIYLDSALCSALADRSTLRASTVENFIRAESDLYMSAVALKEDGFGKFEHHRELSPIDAQTFTTPTAISRRTTSMPIRSTTSPRRRARTARLRSSSAAATAKFRTACRS
jgi:hypothetical protein